MCFELRQECSSEVRPDNRKCLQIAKRFALLICEFYFVFYCVDFMSLLIQ